MCVCVNNALHLYTAFTIFIDSVAILQLIKDFMRTDAGRFHASSNLGHIGGSLFPTFYNQGILLYTCSGHVGLAAARATRAYTTCSTGFARSHLFENVRKAHLGGQARY